MGVLSTFLLVLFIITAILLVLLVLVQDEEGDSLGGVFAGSSSSAFGSRSGNILTKTTSVLGGIFLVLSLGLGLVNRTPSASGVEQAGRETLSSDNSDWWKTDASTTNTNTSASSTPANPAAPVESTATDTNTTGTNDTTESSAPSESTSAPSTSGSSNAENAPVSTTGTSTPAE